MGCGINGSGKLIGPDLGGSVIVIWFISNPLISLILLVRMTCSIPNRPSSFKSTYFSTKYPAITPQSAFASEGACTNSTTTYQDTMYPLTVRYSHIHFQTYQHMMYPLTVRYSHIHFQTLIHSVNTKRDSVKKPIMHRLRHRKEKLIMHRLRHRKEKLSMHRLWQCSIACGNANIQPVLDKNDNAKFSRFRGSVDISSIISSLYFIGRFRQVFVLSEPLELIA